jgi:hypothetical protein
MKSFIALDLGFLLVCLVVSVALTEVCGADRKPAPTRPPTAPGTPALIPAGPKAEALAQAVQNQVASAPDAASNPTEASPGANPPPKADGNFLIGPLCKPAADYTFCAQQLRPGASRIARGVRSPEGDA